MGFEAPWALLALAAAGLPVLAHLLRRRDLPLRPLPTIALLSRAEVATRSRTRLVDLLLLLVRVLLVAALAVGLAAPFVRVPLVFGDGQRASVAIVLDDSLSMTRAEPGGTRLTLAVARAQAILDALPEGSEAAVVLAGAPSRVLVARTEDLGVARRALTNVDARTARGTALADAIGAARRELGGARNGARRLVVLSDFALHTRATELDWDALGVELSAERFGAADAPNAALTGVTVAPDPTTPGSYSLQVEARGVTDGARVRLGETMTALEVHDGVGRATLHAPSPPSGDPTAILALADGDALPLDDTRGVLLRPPASLHVLAVDGDPHPERGVDELRFFVRALERAPDDEGAPLVDVIDPDTFATRDLGDVDVVVLGNVPAPDARTVQALRAFVTRGGGLLVTAGDHVEPRTYEGSLGSLLPARIEAPVVADPAIHLVAPRPHALLPAGDTGLARVEVTRRLVLDPRGDVALAFDDGSAALVTGREGDGRTAVLAIPLDAAWSDLPLRPGFLPLVVGLVRGLAARGALPDRPVPAAAPLTLPCPPGASRLAITPPGGEAVELPCEAESAVFEDTRAPGAYRVQVRARSGELVEAARLAFVVAAPPEESDLHASEPPTRNAQSSATARATTTERPLARWFFLAAGLLAVLEALLRATPSRTRR